MKRLYGLLFLLGLFFLAGCDTSNPMRQPLPVQTGTQIQTSTAVQTSVSSSTNSTQKITYTLDEVKRHNTESDCWTVINGKIYNMSSFSSRHSGGPNPIVSVCGKDGTAIYAKQHGSDTALIQGFFVATLQ